LQRLTKFVLPASAIYLAAIGLSLLAVPLKFGIGAVPADASTQLVALLRLLGGPLLGIAVLNWLSRDAPGSALRPVLLANLVGFGAVAANDVWGIATGEARELAKLFVIFHVLFTLAFAVSLKQRAGAQR
jgi:hypothetical protein